MPKICHALCGTQNMFVELIQIIVGGALAIPDTLTYGMNIALRELHSYTL